MYVCKLTRGGTVCVCVRNRHWLEHNVLTPFKLCVCEGNFVLLCYVCKLTRGGTVCVCVCVCVCV